MSLRQYEKQLRRRRRNERKAEKNALSQTQAGVIASCPDCGADLGSAEKLLAHRPGPCGCLPEIRAVMERVYAVRAKEYEDSVDGHVRCRNCGRMHTDDEQALVVVEGVLAWDGCDYCLKHELQHVLGLLDKHRSKWDGRQIEEAQRIVAAHNKFVAPFTSNPLPVPQSTPSRRKAAIADQADKHSLYEQAVQNPEHDIEFIGDVFSSIRGRDPQSVREDFCGTANFAAAWVRSGRDRTAVAVDLDPAPVDWGKKHHCSKLNQSQRQRLTHIISNVCDSALPTKHAPVEVVVAQNFSYSVFKTRSALLEYFKTVRLSLANDGIFMIDAFGGPQMLGPAVDVNELENFVYVWDQARFDPATNELLCHIHFRFADGSELYKAFTYDWRYWTVPELREIMLEAGFNKTIAMFDVSDDEDETTFVPRESWHDDDAWTGYIVGIV